MCISEPKLEIYEEMLKVEESLYKLDEYTQFQDRAIYPSISMFAKKWTSILDKYHALNRSKFSKNRSKFDKKEE